MNATSDAYGGQAAHLAKHGTELAFTGADLIVPVIASLVLIAAGVAMMMWVARRG